VEDREKRYLAYKKAVETESRVTQAIMKRQAATIKDQALELTNLRSVAEQPALTAEYQKGVKEARGDLAGLTERVLAKKFTIMQASKQGGGDQAQYWS